ncbi:MULTISPECIES: plasmid partitioning protein RepB C-terminal domain-containing protein [Pseudomonas syringae group]|uniref:Chromosome partitioning protein ParB n=5 Tax=Gammaproteobacteria TaxID=1236 RepID=A0A244ET33_PSESX|nr:MULTISPECIES: plasmid partitioning protein RepB C-terminal domain-containing protein [Pseudomonas syringae group]AAO53589.1 ParB family protein [Pseudomonas syringae pv. tomato str. DC3000]KKI25114.1 plasmid stablization protein ParB [Pseudomonas syringae pv. persicae]MBF9245807.1 ParB N-terminal domain-containing protein [Pseudomonas syringae pv. tomato]MBM0209204.1 ParB N-terminal domain-containing protein [Pseudomonas syringae pv. maculicola]MBW8021951.1 chromosome partitioning protein P
MTVPLTTRDRIALIPIAEIHILNPRTRNKKIHHELIENIKTVGLKRPITVSRRVSTQGSFNYDLVCGQGRLEAFLALEATEIPAFVIDSAEEDCLVMSLVENVARRQHRPIDLMNEVGRLKGRGKTDAEIATIIGSTSSWVNMIVNLIERGEEKLLSAVETGLIPLSMATDIARSSESDIQDLLTDAYERGIRGKKITKLRHLLELRAKKDKLVRGNPLGVSQNKKKRLTPTDLRHLFEREAERQRLMVKKAAFTHDRVVFSIQAIKELLAVSDFEKLLSTEHLDSMPKLIQARLSNRGGL